MDATPLRLLIVEDNQSDTELILHALRAAGFDPIGPRVETEQDFREALNPDVEIILCDFSMPVFDPYRALAILQMRKNDIPFIIVSGSIGEENAVDAMQRGVADYVIKDHLGRLGPAVKQALEQKRLRIEARLAERRLMTQYSFAQIVAELPSLVSAGASVLQAICQCESWMFGALWQLDERENVMRCVVCWSHPLAQAADFAAITMQSTFDRSQRNLMADVWNSGQPAWAADVAAIPNFSRASWAVGAGLRGAVGFPITVGKETVGVLEFFNREIKQPDDATLKTMLTIGSQLGQFITRKRAEDALRDSESRFRSLVQATSAVVWSAGPTGEFKLDQPGWRAHTGQTFAQLLGWGWLDAIHPADREQSVEAWSIALAGRALYQVEHRLRRHDGEYQHMMVRGVPILDEDQNVREWVGIHTDIDALKRAEAAQRDAREAAEASNRAKSEFLANMSHEIRTPMNGIIGLTGLALDTEIDSEQRQYLDGVMLSAESLLTIINSILDFSKIEAGKMELEQIDFDLRETMGTAMKTLALRAHEKQLELLYEVLPDVPEALIGDPARLWQIMVNLIGNALKFTQQGEIAVLVELEKLREDSALLRFSVRDTGIGIPADKKVELFEPFVQADASTTRKYGGTGLGLAISVRLAELMGGRIWVESDEGRGSDFRFTARFGLKPVTVPRQTPILPADLGGLRVLVIDDNSANRRIQKNLLARWGMCPTEADSGEVALEMLHSAVLEGAPIDLILLDVWMPGMDGFGVLEQIRKTPEIDRTTILMFSSIDHRGDIARARELGATAYLRKPINPPELLNAIIAAMGHGAERTPQSSAPRMSVDSEKHLRILVAEDNRVNQLLAVRILEKVGHSVEVANNGQEALAALAREAFDLILMDVHMPVMDGFQATRRIRQNELTTGWHIPIVALTAHAMKGDRERCLEAGMDDYVAKPIQKNELFTAIAAAMAGSSQPRPILDGLGSTVNFRSPTRYSILDLEHANRVASSEVHAIEKVVRSDDPLADDPELRKELAKIFLEDCPRLLAEIRTAMTQRNGTALKIAAHMLKGSAGVFNVKPAYDAAFRVERIGHQLDWEHAEEAWTMINAEMKHLSVALEFTK